MKLFLIIVSSLLLWGCGPDRQIEEAKKMSDKLLNDIPSGKAAKSFPEKYFSSGQGERMVDLLNEKCDFINRKGNFVNDFWGIENGEKRVFFIYEYYLKCDSLRLILGYNLGDIIELYAFRVEPIEKDNPMILKPERRLKF